MSVLRGRTEYNEKDNIISIQDLFELNKLTGPYRSSKVDDLRKEHALLIRRIKRLKTQKIAYMEKLGVLPTEDSPDVVAPVDYEHELDTPVPESSSDLSTNRKILHKTPTDAFLAYSRDTIGQTVREIDIRIRDYDYELKKLSLQEQKTSLQIDYLLSNESNARANNV